MITSGNQRRLFHHILKEIILGATINSTNQMKLSGLNKQKQKQVDHTLNHIMGNRFTQEMESQDILSTIKVILLLRTDMIIKMSKHQSFPLTSKVIMLGQVTSLMHLMK